MTAVRAAPVLPRVAILPEREPKPVAAANPTVPGGGGSAGRERRAGRVALLAACVALAASFGAMAGAAGLAGLQSAFPGAFAAVAPEANEEVRALKETVGQLRANVKTLSDSLAAMRASITLSSSAANLQLAKITEGLDRVERGERERRVAAAAPPPETTGSIAPSSGAFDPKSALKPPIVEGWTLRRVYDGAALIEGRYGIVEIAPGEHVPGIGRIQEIKRQDGHWVVVTPKGLIVPLR